MTLVMTEQHEYMQLALAEGGPIDADLMQNVEVKFTDAITAKAAELGNNPIKIYNWVRNNVEFAPTYGSIQGADMCMQTLECNAFDTASLLIAMLRTSDIPARYAYGTVEMPIEKFMNWTGGFTNATAALDFAMSGGIPTTGLQEGGEYKAARLEHVWVEAWVDMTPSFGAIMGSGGKTWTPLDGSFKQYAYTDGMDIAQAVPFDAEALVNDIVGSATINEAEGWVTGVDSALIENAMTDYKAQVESYFTSEQPDATVGDVLGTKTIVKMNHQIFMGTLPYKLRTMGTRHSEIPDGQRHKIKFEVTHDFTDPINITYAMPAIAGKKITLSYSPATQADEDVINSYIPVDGNSSELPTSLPAYLINVKPELRIDGQVMGTGGAVTLGTQETLTMNFQSPAHSDDIITNKILAGEYFGIAVSVSGILLSEIEKVKQKISAAKTNIDSQNYSQLSRDNTVGEILYLGAIYYLYELNRNDEVLANSLSVNSITLPSEAIFKQGVSVVSSFGVPVSAASDGLYMDVDRILSFRNSLSGNTEDKIHFTKSLGIVSSALEHLIPELLLSSADKQVEALSAVKALEIANESNIPLFLINNSNITDVLPLLNLDAEVIEDIRNSVNAGKDVFVSQSNIDFNGWIGCGYVVIDNATGAGAYMISGSYSGSTVRENVDKLLALITDVMAEYGISIHYASISYYLDNIEDTLRTNPSFANAKDLAFEEFTNKKLVEIQSEVVKWGTKNKLSKDSAILFYIIQIDSELSKLSVKYKFRKV